MSGVFRTNYGNGTGYEGGFITSEEVTKTTEMLRASPLGVGIGQGINALAGTAAQLYSAGARDAEEAGLPMGATQAGKDAQAIFAENREIDRLSAMAFGGGGNLVRGVAKGLTQAAPSLATGPGALVAGALSVGVSTYAEKREELIEQGVAIDDANWTALPSGAFSMAGVAAPAAIGIKGLAAKFPGLTKASGAASTDIAARMVTGAGMNFAFGVADRQGSALMLREKGYNEVADYYDQANAGAGAVDLILGAIFGGLSVGRAGIRDALEEADYMRRNMATVAVPKTGEGITLNQGMMEHAGESVLSGKKVDVNTVLAGRKPEDTFDFDMAVREKVEVESSAFEPAGRAGEYDAIDPIVKEGIDSLFMKEEQYDPDVMEIKSTLAEGQDTQIRVKKQLTDGTEEYQSVSLKQELADTDAEIKRATQQAEIFKQVTDCLVVNGDL